MSLSTIYVPYHIISHHIILLIIIISLSVCVYVECGCEVSGTVGWSTDCHVMSGQCLCRPFVNNRQCDQCVDGAYNLQQHNAFGCQRMYHIILYHIIWYRPWKPLCIPLLQYNYHYSSIL